VRLIVNQANDRTEAGRVADRLRMVSRRFLGLEVDTLGHLLVDERIRMAVRRRRPFVVEFPRGPGALGIRQICERVLGENRPRPKQGFFKRFAEAIDRRS
jgi:flagellar biosynthesis protein FlhG